MAKGRLSSDTRVFHGLRKLSFRPRGLTHDLVAGLTLWAVVAPQTVAYADIARVPPSVALGSVPLAMAIYGFLGPSKRLVAAANSAVAITSGLLVATLGGGEPAEMVALSATLAVCAGSILFLVGIVRWGFLADFFAAPVVTGFLLGVAVLIILSQLPKLLGIPTEHGEGLMQLVEIGRRVGEAHHWTVAIGVGSLLLLLLLDRGPIRIRGSTLWVVVVGVVLGALLRVREHGVETVGAIPTTRVALTLPSFSLGALGQLLVGAAGIAMIGFSETIAVARRLAGPQGRAVHSNKELIALGAANLGAGFAGGFAVCGSLSATEVNQQAGARTSLASLFAAAFVFLTGFFFAGLLETLPQAVLGAVVIQAAVGSIRIHSIARLWRIRKSDFVLASISFLGVCSLGILQGLLLAIFLSAGLVVFRAGRAPYSVLGEAEGNVGFEDVAANPTAVPIPGILIFRFDAPMFFGNARRVHESLQRLVEEQKPRVVIVDMELTFELDSSAADELVHVVEDLEDAGVEVCFARVRSQPRAIFQRPAARRPRRGTHLPHRPRRGRRPRLAPAARRPRRARGASEGKEMKGSPRRIG